MRKGSSLDIMDILRHKRLKRMTRVATNRLMRGPYPPRCEQCDLPMWDFILVADIEARWIGDCCFDPTIMTAISGWKKTATGRPAGA